MGSVLEVRFVEADGSTGPAQDVGSVTTEFPQRIGDRDATGRDDAPMDTTFCDRASSLRPEWILGPMSRFRG